MSRKRAVYYVDPPLVEPEEGQVFRVGGKITSVVTPSGLFKSLEPWGSEDEAYECLYHWKKRGYTGAPSSPASFARETLRELKRKGKVRFKPFAFANRRLPVSVHGGWQETRVKGFLRRPVWHYDINRAYLWSAYHGLPVDLRPYEPGAENFVAVYDLHGAEGELPNFLERAGSGYVLVTRRDIDLYRLHGRVVDGVAWEKEAPVLQPMFEELRGLPPKAFKRLTQSYWGMFAMQRAVVGESYRNGRRVTRWTLPLWGQHIVWAVVIVHRIVRSVYRQMVAADGVQCFVDSVLSLKPLETGSKPGEWSHEGSYPNGIYVEAPGVWTALPRPSSYLDWTKHSGIASPMVMK